MTNSPNLFLKAIDFFNDDDFFSAHDLFEEIWVESIGDEKLFFQGLVQVSVAYFHLVSKNYVGAKSMLIKSISKLEKFLPEFNGIDTDALVSKMKLTIFEIDKYFNDNSFILTYKNIPKLIISTPLKEN
ncbi:MAG: DUF309 domain-containing protein [Ignavibacteriaceae bacterium]|nr:DUF309 domain-containing protein [Ignavibacteriaceae bacterium]HRI45665.1 DUF309 domain-containing protein [Ignavibacteriaceae bacterium]